MFADETKAYVPIGSDSFSWSNNPLSLRSIFIVIVEAGGIGHLARGLVRLLGGSGDEPRYARRPIHNESRI